MGQEKQVAQGAQQAPAKQHENGAQRADAIWHRYRRAWQNCAAR